jgi:MoaD family protein
MAQIKASYFGLFQDMTQRRQDILQFERPVLGNLLRELEARYGRRFTESVVDPQTNDLQSGVMVLVNGRRLDFSAPLQDGDEVAFMIAMAGGMV